MGAHSAIQKQKCEVGQGPECANPPDAIRTFSSPIASVSSLLHSDFSSVAFVRQSAAFLDRQILGIERVCPLWRKLRRFGPLIGLRAFLSLTEKLSLEGDRYRWLRRWLFLHIVGVGDGQASAWLDCFGFTYVFSSQRYVSADYNVLNIDYYHNGRAHDARFNDPVLGVTIRF
jgi:hypothetical protein